MRNKYFLLTIIIIFWTTKFLNAEQKNNQILFSSSNESGVSNIYSLKMDSYKAKKILNSKNWDFWPRWSVKSKRIVFCSKINNGKDFEKSKLWIMDINGKEIAKLTDGDYDDFFPNWSPDGTKIVFQSFRDNNGEIYLMDFKDKSVKRLTTNTFEDSYPSFTPDGKRIIYQSKQSKKVQAMVMNLDGTEQTSIFKDKDIEKVDNSAFDLPPNSKSPNRRTTGNNEFAPLFNHSNNKMYVILDNYNIPPQIYEYDLQIQSLEVVSIKNEKGRNIYENYFDISLDDNFLITTSYSDLDKKKQVMTSIIDLNNNSRSELNIGELEICYPTWFNIE